MAPTSSTCKAVSPENPFNTQESTGSEFRIRVSGSLRDAGWAAHFGTLQAAMAECKFNEKTIDRVALDLSLCTWADPLPLLTSTMALAVFVQQGGKAEILLPRPDSPGVKHKRLLRFIALEGFANQMLDLGISLKNALNPSIDSQQISEFAKIEVPLRYADSRCIPAWILSLSADMEEALGQITKGINERFVRAEVLLRVEERSWANTRLLYGLKVFLRETLVNIAEHAYGIQSSARLAAVYVRYRRGGLKISPAEKMGWLNELSEEQKQCPQLHRNYLALLCLVWAWSLAQMRVVSDWSIRNRLEGTCW